MDILRTNIHSIRELQFKDVQKNKWQEFKSPTTLITYLILLPLQHCIHH